MNTKNAVVLSFDLGGTKLLAGVINSRGQILDRLKERTALKDGPHSLIMQMVRMGQTLIQKYPTIRRVGIASAGPLHPQKGVLLDPTNFFSNGRSWGKVALTQPLSKKLRKPVFLENDAAASILAEAWVGAAKKTSNAMILTLGTGLGTGIICNGELVRSGRHLHPEAGHLILDANDQTALCGCGNFGCAEAYLSGSNFEKRFNHMYKKKFKAPLTAVEITELALKKNHTALKAFDDYADHMATAIHNYVVLYSPQLVLFTGSFSQALPLFLPRTQKNLKKLLSRRRVGEDLLPQFKKAHLDNDAGLIGGAFIAFSR